MPATPKHFAQAIAKHQAGAFKAAESDYRKILAKAPRDVTVLYHLGIVLHQQGKTDEAKKVLAKTVATAPDFPEAHFSLGVVLMELGQHDEAEVALRRVIALRPEMQPALVRLGELLVLQKKLDKAVPLLRRALQLRADDRKALVSLGIALRRLEQFEQAIEVNNHLLVLDSSEDIQSLMSDTLYHYYIRDPDSAREHARRWIAAFPDSAFAQHMGAGLLGLPAPERASDSYVRNLFDNFAESFEEQLADLGYRAPDVVASMAGLGDAKGDWVILDAGCGTGLAAPSLRPAASKLIGVDLSPRMLEIARGKGMYDELVEMELGAYLKSNIDTFDVIVAADVLNYFGDLAPVLTAAANALRPGGRLAFSLECGAEGGGFTLGPHGRYSHDKIYMADLVQQAGLQLQTTQEAVLRKEFGKEVIAYLILATKQDQS